MVLQELEGIANLRLCVGSDGEVGTSARYARKEDKLAGVEDG
jgi:hypothetical protein